MGNAIQDKTKAFAIKIINCYKFLTEEQHEFVMSKQMLRCGTSIGANTRESKNAQSRNDFLSKLSIALKEADETDYWLDLLHSTDYIDNDTYDSLATDCAEIIKIDSLATDCAEIIKILTAIIKTLKGE